MSIGDRSNIPNYLVQSILVTICCCLPFGIVAIVNAAGVNSKLAAGDVAGAQVASQAARKWCIIGLISGIIVNVVGGIIYALMVAAAMNDPALKAQMGM